MGFALPKWPHLHREWPKNRVFLQGAVSIAKSTQCNTDYDCKTCIQKLMIKDLGKENLCNLLRCNECSGMFTTEKALRKHQRICRICNEISIVDCGICWISTLSKELKIRQMFWRKSSRSVFEGLLKNESKAKMRLAQQSNNQIRKTKYLDLTKLEDLVPGHSIMMRLKTSLENQSSTKPMGICLDIKACQDKYRSVQSGEKKRCNR